MTDKLRLLDLLREAGPEGVHTRDLRRMGVSGNPSQRRLDLIADGHCIDSERESYTDASGKSRPGSRYFLRDASLDGDSRRADAPAAPSLPDPVEPVAVEPGADPEPRLFSTLDIDIPPTRPSYADADLEDAA